MKNSAFEIRLENAGVKLGTDYPRETFCKSIQKLNENNFFSQLFLFLRELKNKTIFNLFIFLHNFYRDYIPNYFYHLAGVEGCRDPDDGGKNRYKLYTIKRFKNFFIFFLFPQIKKLKGKIILIQLFEYPYKKSLLGNQYFKFKSFHFTFHIVKLILYIYYLYLKRYILRLFLKVLRSILKIRKHF